MAGRASTSQLLGSAGPSGAAVETPLPLQISLLWLVVATYTTNGSKDNQIHSSTFIACILEVISGEILELGQYPADFSTLRSKTNALLKAEATTITRNNQKLRARGQHVSAEREEAAEFSSWMDRFAEQFENVDEGCACLDLLESDARATVNETDDEDLTDEPEPVERHSVLGVFIRRLLLRLRKLSFDETSQLARQIGQWCGRDAGPSRIHVSSLNRRLAMEDSLEQRTSAMHDYKSASRSGDYSRALASLRRFYDYQQPMSGRGQHQHALLNLANFYHSTGGLDSAKAAIDEAVKVSRAEGDRACLQACMSLSTRIDTEINARAFGHLEPPRATSSAIPESRLPEASTPMDDLWAMKAALDMGESASVAFRRIHRALGRHQAVPNKHTNKDTSASWASQLELDLAAWHSAQAGLWDMMGSDALAELHEDLVDERITGGADGRLTVVLARASRATRRGDWDEALKLLLATSTFEGLSMDEYNRWSRAVWAVFEARTKMTEDNVALAIIESMRPAPTLSRRVGPGGNARELGNSEDVRPREGLLFAHDEVRDLLRKTRKLLKADTPAHLILPDVLSAVHLSSQLSLWPLFREATVLLSLVMLNMEGADLAGKVKTELLGIQDQVLASQDEELITLLELALGEAEIAIALSPEDDQDPSFGIAKTHLYSALERAERLQSHELIDRLSTSIALISEGEGDEGEREIMTSVWDKQQTGDGERLADEREQIKQFGRMIRMVGLRVAEGWR